MPCLHAGAGVTDSCCGDDVFGIAHGCLGTVVVGSAATLTPLPPGISHQEAATTPTVLLTVDVALQQLADVQPGDKVLIHAATGGVGLAAVQVRMFSISGGTLQMSTKYPDGL